MNAHQVQRSKLYRPYQFRKPVAYNGTYGRSEDTTTDLRPWFLCFVPLVSQPERFLESRNTEGVQESLTGSRSYSQTKEGRIVSPQAHN